MLIRSSRVVRGGVHRHPRHVHIDAGHIHLRRRCVCLRNGGGRFALKLKLHEGTGQVAHRSGRRIRSQQHRKQHYPGFCSATHSRNSMTICSRSHGGFSERASRYTFGALVGPPSRVPGVKDSTLGERRTSPKSLLLFEGFVSQVSGMFLSTAYRSESEGSQSRESLSAGEANSVAEGRPSRVSRLR